MVSRVCGGALALLVAFTASASAAGLPKKVGACVSTTISELSSRLEGDPESGSAVSFKNGGYQVSYDIVAEIQQSRVGDPVKMCLTALPEDCPKADDRGKIYKTTNLRTHQSWELPDSEHSCGGA